jgi:hypothetical protein
MKKEETTFSYKFENGIESKGTFEQLVKIAEAFGEKLDFSKFPGSVVPRGWYPSESKGLIKISEMTDYHLRRALLKRSKDYLSTVFDASTSNAEFLTKYQKMVDDSIIVDLFIQLSSKK